MAHFLMHPNLDSKPPELEAPPEYKLAKSRAFVVSFCFSCGLFCLLTSNWVGAGVNLFFVCLHLYLEYRKRKLFNWMVKNLKALQAIASTPRFQEEKQSVIFTFVAPSSMLERNLANIYKKIGIDGPHDDQQGNPNSL